jgi:hypothetical protein
MVLFGVLVVQIDPALAGLNWDVYARSIRGLKSLPINKAIVTFHGKIQDGCEYVLFGGSFAFGQLVDEISNGVFVIAADNPISSNGIEKPPLQSTLVVSITRDGVALVDLRFEERSNPPGVGGEFADYSDGDRKDFVIWANPLMPKKYS